MDLNNTTYVFYPSGIKLRINKKIEKFNIWKLNNTSLKNTEIMNL